MGLARVRQLHCSLLARTAYWTGEAQEQCVPSANLLKVVLHIREAPL